MALVLQGGKLKCGGGGAAEGIPSRCQGMAKFSPSQWEKEGIRVIFLFLLQPWACSISERIVSDSDKSRRFHSNQIKGITFAVARMVSGWRTREDVRFVVWKPISRQGFQLCFVNAAQYYTLYCAYSIPWMEKQRIVSPAFSKTSSSS